MTRIPGTTFSDADPPTKGPIPIEVEEKETLSKVREQVELWMKGEALFVEVRGQIAKLLGLLPNPVEIKMLVLTDGLLTPPGAELVRERRIFQEAKKVAAEGWVISTITNTDSGACVYFHRISPPVIEIGSTCKIEEKP